MSISLFKSLIKRNWLLLAIFIAILTMYQSVMILMYNPDDMEALTAMIKMLPEEMMQAMGFTNAITDLTGYLASWLYGMLMLGFPMVYAIILGNRLVAKMVDNSSFAYLLSTPNSRNKIIFTSGVFALSTVAVLFAAMFLIGTLICSIVHPGLLDVSAFLKLNITTMLVNMTVMMITFFFSCVFNETRLSLSFGAGIPILFLLMNMLGSAAEKIEFIKNVSIYGMYDPVGLVHGSDVFMINAFYIILIIALFTGGLTIFKRKRLPL